LFTEIFPIIPHAHPNSSKNFQLWFNLIFHEDVFNIQLLLHNKSKCHEIKQVHFYLPKVFQRCQDLQLKHLYAPPLNQSFPKIPRFWIEALWSRRFQREKQIEQKHTTFFHRYMQLLSSFHTYRWVKRRQLHASK